MNRLKSYAKLILAIGFLCVMIACRNDMEKVKFFDRKTLPSQMVKEAEVVRSSSGKLQMVMKAPEIDTYDSPEKKTIYPKGITLVMYDENRKPKATMTAGYAISFEDRQLMEAKKKVVIIDHHTGDTTYLENIVWNKMEERIYSNHLIKSVNGQRVTYGDGFESDQDFRHPLIIRQRGTIEWNEEL